MKTAVRFTTILAAVILMTAAPASAFTQHDGTTAPRHWWSAGISGCPISGNGFITNYIPGDISSIREIKDLYGDYESASTTTGTFYGEFGWNVSKTFNACVSAGFAPIWSTLYDGYYGQPKKKYFGGKLYAMAEARIMYVNRAAFRFYSSLGLGLGASIGTEYNHGSTPCIIIQLDPIGMEFGNKWFGTFKLGIGTEFTGAKIGFGHRF